MYVLEKADFSSKYCLRTLQVVTIVELQSVYFGVLLTKLPGDVVLFIDDGQ